MDKSQKDNCHQEGKIPSLSEQPSQLSGSAEPRILVGSPCMFDDDFTLIQDLFYSKDTVEGDSHGDFKTTTNMEAQTNQIISPVGSCLAGNPEHSEAVSVALTSVRDTEATKSVQVKSRKPKVSKKEQKRSDRAIRREKARAGKKESLAVREVEAEIQKEMETATDDLDGNQVSSSKLLTSSEEDLVVHKGEGKTTEGVRRRLTEFQKKYLEGNLFLPKPPPVKRTKKTVFSKKGGRSVWATPNVTRVVDGAYHRQFTEELEKVMHEHPADPALVRMMRAIAQNDSKYADLPYVPFDKDSIKKWKKWACTSGIYFTDIVQIAKLHYHARGSTNGLELGELGSRMHMNLKLHRPMKQKDFTIQNTMQDHYDEQESLHKQAHHHPDGKGGCGSNYIERLYGTIECLCDLWCCAMHDTDSYNTAYDNFAKWIYDFDKNGQIVGLKLKFAKLERLGLFMFYCAVAKYGVTEHKFATFKNARKNRSKPLSFEAKNFDWQAAMESRRVPDSFRKIPEQNDYMYETMIHCNMVDNLARFFIPHFNSHDRNKFFERSMVAYTWKWYVSGKDIRPTMLASGGRKLVQSVSSLLNTIKTSLTTTAIETASGMEISELQEMGEKISEDVDGISDMVKVSADKIKALVAPTMKMFGVVQDSANSLNISIELVKLYILYINCSSPVLQGLLFIKALHALQIFPIVSKNFTAYMMQADASDVTKINEEMAKTIEAAQSASSGQEEIKSTSITDNIFDFISHLYEGLKKHTVGILAVAASFLVCILTGKFYAAGKFKNLASKLNQLLIDAGFTGRAVINLSGMLVIFKNLFTSVQTWIREEFFGVKPEGIDEDIVNEFQTWMSTVNILVDSLSTHDLNANKCYRDDVMKMYKKMGEFELLFAKYPCYDKYNRLLASRRRTFLETYKSVCRMETQPTFRKVPFHISLCGDAGIGKSSIVESLLNHISDKFYEGEGTSYCRTATSKFWDSYNGQNVVIYDDLGPTNDYEHYGELLTIISHVVVILQKAHLEEKGTPFTSDFLISTTNNPWPNVQGSVCLNALWRRYHLLVRPVLADKEKNVFEKSGFSQTLFDQHYPSKNSMEYPHLKFQICAPMEKNKVLRTVTYNELLNMIDEGFQKMQSSGYGQSLEERNRAHERCKEILTELRDFKVNNKGEHVQLHNFISLFGKKDGEENAQDSTAEVIGEFPELNISGMDQTALKNLKALATGKPAAFEVYLDSILALLPLGTDHNTPDKLDLLEQFKAAAKHIRETETSYRKVQMTVREALVRELIKQVKLTATPSTQDWCMEMCCQVRDMLAFMELMTDTELKDFEHCIPIRSTAAKDEVKLRKQEQDAEIEVNKTIRELQTHTDKMDGAQTRLWEEFQCALGATNKFTFANKFKNYLRGKEIVHDPDDQRYDLVISLFSKLELRLTLHKIAYYNLHTDPKKKEQPDVGVPGCHADDKTFMEGAKILQTNLVDEEMVMSQVLNTEYFLYMGTGEKFSSRCGWSVTCEDGFPVAEEIALFGKFKAAKIQGWKGGDMPFFDPGHKFSQYFLSLLSKVKVNGKLYWSIRRCPHVEKRYLKLSEVEQEKHKSCYLRFGNGEEFAYCKQFKNDIYYFMALSEEQRGFVFKKAERYRKAGDALYRKQALLAKADETMEATFGRIWGYGKWIWEKIGWFQQPLIALILTCGAVGILKAIGKLFNPRPIHETSSVFKGPRVAKIMNTSEQMINANIIANIRKVSIGMNKVTGLIIRNHMMLVPEHAVFAYRENKHLSEIPMTIYYGDKSLHTFQVDKKDCIRIEGADLCLIHKTSIGTGKDIIAHFMREEDLRAEKGKFVALINKQFQGDVMTPVVTQLEYHGSEYQIPLGNQINCKAFAFAHAFKYAAKDGESGSPVLNWLPNCTNGKRVIMGFQWGTQGGISYCSSIPQEALFELADGLTRNGGFRFEDPPYMEGFPHDTIRTTAEVLNPYGRAPAHYATVDSIKSNYVTTPLYGELPTERMPSVTDKYSPYATNEHPWMYSVNKHGRGLIIDKDTELYREAVVEVADYWKRKIGKLRLLPLREAIEGNENLAHIPLNTSPGIPWIFERGNVPGKRKFIQLDEFGHATWVPLVEERHGQWMNLLKNKVVPSSIRYTIGKDELRPVTKALGITAEEARKFKLNRPVTLGSDRIVNTRTIECGPLDETLCYRVLNGDLVGKMGASSNGNEMYCPGINIHSMSATNMYLKCLSLNDKGVDMDVKNWDSHQTTQNAYYVAMFNNLVYGDDQESPTGKARQTLELMAIQGFVQFGRDIFYKQLGECSGFPGTTHSNTMSHIFLSVVQWKRSCLEAKRPDLASFDCMRKHVANYIYGDDRLVVVSREMEELGIYTPEFLQRDYQERGYPVTPADKSNEVKLVSLFKLQFLKCNFVPDPKLSTIYHLALDPKVCYDLVIFLKNKKNPISQFAENVQFACEYLVPRGEKIYNSFRISVACGIDGTEFRNVDLPHYHNVHRVILERVMGIGISSETVADRFHH